jgi:50S ribosomal protein L16 3-hydroxylase
MPDTPLFLGGLSPTTFLRRHWQKQPLLIRNAFPGFESFITRKQLFALACRADVQARLVREKGGRYPWQVSHGPFRPSMLKKLPKRHWSLLVQHVNLLVPEAAELLRRFFFVPNWRVDDLMVSCAPAGGSVGAHLDSYDVFLLQAAGLRRWAINHADYDESDFKEGLDLRILANFRADEEYLVGPGDMLYLPPGVAHHGVALEDCLTFSIGFRAPSRLEAAGRFLDELPQEQDMRYCDPGLEPQRHPGEITQQARAAVRALIRDTTARDRDIDLWFGRHVTALPEGMEPAPLRRPLSERNFTTRLSRSRRLRLATAARAAFTRIGGRIVLFVNGRAHQLPGTCTAFVQMLADHGEAAVPGRVPPALLRALHSEYTRGSLRLV